MPRGQEESCVKNGNRNSITVSRQGLTGQMTGKEESPGPPSDPPVSLDIINVPWSVMMCERETL